MRRELHRGSGLAVRAAVVTALLVAITPAARADSEEQARALFRQGVELSSQGRWSEAEALFRRSHAEVPRASTAYNLTLALLHLGRGREALDVLSDLSTRYGQEHAYRDQVEALRAHALQLVARVTLHVSPDGASVELDGHPVPGGGTRLAVVDPGEHRVRASAPGHRPIERLLRAHAAEELSERIELEPEPPAVLEPEPRELAAAPRAAVVAAPASIASAAPAPDRGPVTWPAIALAGTGGALLVAGGVLGVLALDANAELDEACPDRTRCPPARRERIELLHARKGDYATAADVLLISGAAAASAGIVWWLLTPDERAPSVSAAVAPDGALVSVRRWF